ncbi:MAG: zinc-dependent peptidase [Elainellaceae cyanobacterium]
MLETLIVLVLIAVIIIWIFIDPVLVKRRRNRLKQRPFPALWAAILENNLAVYTQLSPVDRRQLQGHIQVFLAQKQFIGCAGLQVSEEMQVTIAAIACLLILNGQDTYFPKLRSILVYPSAYFVNQTTTKDGHIVEEQRVARLGESWLRDQMVLAWEQVRYDSHHWQDGRNVVLHEFAHQLDQEDGNAEGVPILRQASDYLQWAEVMTEEYQQLCYQVEQGAKTVLDPYGATNPAEFFAVATETFFEKPQLLLKRHPALYMLLQHYYRLDPAQWQYSPTL